MKKPELLSPVGDFECLKAAVQNGADSVYLGSGNFNARVRAKNFDLNELSEAIKYAKLRDVKVNVTLNILIKDEEFEEAAKIAKQHNFDYFCSTLTVSPHKNSKIINEIGKNLEDIYNIKWLYSDFKKNEGFKKSIELSKEYNLYRQDYCGCIYSQIAKEKQEI